MGCTVAAVERYIDVVAAAAVVVGIGRCWVGRKVGTECILEEAVETCDNGA